MAGKRPEAQQFPRERVPCVYAGCAHPAILAVWTKTGWARLCEHHRAFRMQQSAEKYCAERGLKTVAQMRAFVLENARKIGRPKTLREPGDDMEEAA